MGRSENKWKEISFYIKVSKREKQNICDNTVLVNTLLTRWKEDMARKQVEFSVTNKRN
jgi:hypothetical protein